MKKLGHTLLAAAFVFIASGPVFAQQPAPGSDPIINYEAGDAAMNAAIAEARAHLGFFWQHQQAKARNESDFALKVGIPTTIPGGPTREHIWVDRVTRSGSGLTAYLANEPGWLAGKHEGLDFCRELGILRGRCNRQRPWGRRRRYPLGWGSSHEIRRYQAGVYRVLTISHYCVYYTDDLSQCPGRAGLTRF